MNPSILNQMPRVPATVGHLTSGDESETTTAAPFHVGSRLALGSSFVGVVDHLSFEEETEGHSPPLVKTQGIPIRSSSMKRTPSELQLKEEEELADYRDYVMFSRIVDRMSRSQRETMSRHLRYENDQCLAHVIKTRNSGVETSTRPPSFPFLDPSRVTLSDMDNLVEQFAVAMEDDEQEEEEDVMFDLEL